MNVLIRDATIDDSDTIVRYNMNLAHESEELELDEETLRGGVQRALARPDFCRYFVAEVDGKVAAQTMLTYEWSDWKNGLIWWIQSVYVDHAFRGQGVFRRIFEYLEHLASDDGDVVALRLYVAKDNHNAMATYEKLGMHHPGYLMYEKSISPLTEGQ